jgi:[acyl-carrier-protein] S-malonyltransferase
VTVAVVFPGQGSQNTSMLDTFEESKIFNDVINEGSGILGYEISEIVSQEDKLNNTIYTQPIILTVSYAIWKTLLDETNFSVTLGAGHSLGEYTALVANGTLEFKEALLLVKKRAELMSKVMENMNGAMAAVIGLDGSIVNQLCKETSKENAIIEAVNYNCPGQTVIAGHESMIDDMAPVLKNAGAKIVKKLPVSLAAHTTLLKDVAVELKDKLENIKLASSSFDIVHNFDLSQGKTGNNLREVLSQQVCSPVRWIETMEKFKSNKITDIIEVGPGNVLSGLIKRFDKSINLYSTKTIEDIKLTSQAL